MQSNVTKKWSRKEERRKVWVWQRENHVWPIRNSFNKRICTAHLHTRTHIQNTYETKTCAIGIQMCWKRTNTGAHCSDFSFMCADCYIANTVHTCTHTATHSISRSKQTKNVSHHNSNTVKYEFATLSINWFHICIAMCAWLPIAVVQILISVI